MWAGLIAAAFGLSLTTLDITVNVALPEISDSFGTTLETVQWIIIFYVGSTTGMELGLGGAADVYGLKRLYVIGLLTYTLAVFLIGVAPTLDLVLGLRVLQAAGNGLILASAPAIVTLLHPPRQRGRALGTMVGLGTLGAIAGSAGGGFLVDALGWRVIFLARVPLGLLAIAVAVIALDNGSETRQRPPYDLRGSVTLFAGLASLILFIAIGGREGWTLPHVIALGAVALVALSAFVVVERSRPHPIMDLTILRHRVLVPALLASLLVTVGTFVSWFILPFYVSDVLGASARTWGLMLMVMMLAGAATSPVGGWISDRTNPSYAITAALAVSALAMLWFSRLDASSDVGDVAVRMAVAGVGMGMFQAANANLIMGHFASDRLAMGGAIMSVSRSLGTVSSVAIMGALFSARLAARAGTAADGGGPGEPHVFVLALHDLYLVSALLSTAAVVVSLSYWPRALRALGPKKYRA
jgi:EmrB/QacA subfamily drug resistance transporter